MTENPLGLSPLGAARTLSGVSSAAAIPAEASAPPQTNPAEQTLKQFASIWAPFQKMQDDMGGDKEAFANFQMAAKEWLSSVISNASESAPATSGY